jgi:hypothetical protein
MATPQTLTHMQQVQVLVSSEPVVVRQPAKDAPQPSMVVRNPAPDASAPMVQTEHRSFSLSF